MLQDIDIDLLQSFALEFGVSFKNAERTSQASLSHAYILDDRYVLRSRLLRDASISEFEREIMLVEAAEEYLPYEFPRALSTKDGRRYLIYSDRFWTIYPIIKGWILSTWKDTGEVTDEHKEFLFRNLRAMHERTLGKLNHNHTNYFLSEIERCIPRLEEHLDKEIISNVESAVSSVKDFTAGLTLDDLCFIHGDFHFGNIVLNEAFEIVGLLDMDWVRVGHPFEDVAYTTMMYMRDYSKEVFDLDYKKLRQMMDWYGVRKEDERIFMDYFLLSIFDNISIPKNERDLRYSRYQKSYLKAVCEFLKDC